MMVRMFLEQLQTSDVKVWVEKLLIKWVFR